MKVWVPSFGLLAAMMMGTAVEAVQVPFVEDFSAGTENWVNTSQAALTHFDSDGPDGGSYVSTDVPFSDAPPDRDAIVLFRGEEDFLASDGAFLDDWIADGAGLLTAYVRHQAPEPLEFFARIATEFNFPGATIQDRHLVEPDVWTPIRFPVSPDYARLTLEGPFDFAAVFEDVGNVQFGVSIPESQEGNTSPYTYDLALVGVQIPEPSSVAIASGLIFCCAGMVRRRGR